MTATGLRRAVIHAAAAAAGRVLAFQLDVRVKSESRGNVAKGNEFQTAKNSNLRDPMLHKIVAYIYIFFIVYTSRASLLFFCQKLQ